MRIPRAQPRTKLLILLVTLSTIAVASLAVWIAQGVADREAAQAESLLRRKNAALAILENMPNERGNSGAECIAAFVELAELLPDDALGPRNLAIARLLALEKLKLLADTVEPEKFRTASEACESALDDIVRRGDDPGIYHMLAAKRAALLEDHQRVVSEYRLAAAAMPTAYTPWSELYLHATEFGLADVRAEALQKAVEIEPNNVVLLLDQLAVLAADRDPTFTAMLSEARPTVGLFADQFRRYNLEAAAVLDGIIADARSNDAEGWPRAHRSLQRMTNLIRSPNIIYQRDQDRLRRHPLEFALHEFSALEGRPTRAPHEEPLHIEFAPFLSARQIPAVAGVLDAALADFDLDQQLDVVVLSERRITLFGQTDRGSWVSLAAADVPAGLSKLLLADLDRDTVARTAPGDQEARPTSDLDVILFGAVGVHLLQYELPAAGEEHTFIAVESPFAAGSPTGVTAVAAADVEHDGDLDLIVAGDSGITVWANNENWGFVDVSTRSSLPAELAAARKIIPVDFNRDVLIDLVVLDRNGRAGLLENVRHSRFRWIDLPGQAGPGQGFADLVVAELDGDAAWDLAAGGATGVLTTRSRTAAPLATELWRTQRVSEAPAGGLQTLDFDNDGVVDLAAWQGSTLELLRGAGAADFEPGVTVIPPLAALTWKVGDLDADGDQDLLAVSRTGLICYENKGGNSNHWIDIGIRGEEAPKFPSHRCNLWGYGSLIELKAGLRYQAHVVSDTYTHFGLGSQRNVDAIRVLWTNGIPQNELAPLTRQTIFQDQRLLQGSCPYLYTWTGERYEFLTDLLWAAPLGLQIREGECAPFREWEYIRIPGERLAELDGEYRLQITEELWEAAYFDAVRLIAVDHPAGVDVFSNEKVGPAEIAAFHVHTVRQLKSPRSARDSSGRDVLGLISQRDDSYVRAFDRRYKQGLTERHFVEVDLGQLSDPGSVKLFLTGWVFPTDTSVNIAISQNPALELPQPPSLWVPDGNGGWREAIAHLGFPGGKTKTIVVEVPGSAFAAGDYRLRIATSMELYWDAIQFSVDEPAAPVELTEIMPGAADLHYRGFSARVPHPGNGPESYRYDEVSRDRFWPPMSGKFTRYGDVTELTANADDYLVVLGAGDELTLRFPVPPNKPPAGWQRDFLLHSVGWDKDANLNTISGHSVEPLPYRAMSQYPYSEDHPWAESPAFRRYLREYQTREQTRTAFQRQLSYRVP